jgi:succinate dehydrogenase hydrophobic anchor subunit
MNQALTIFISAVVIGVIAVAILSAYTNANASKLPEQKEIVQVFLSGSIVGSFLAWLVTSGVLHGSSVMNMLSEDISSAVSESGLKGGDESIVNTFDGPEVVKTNVVKNADAPGLSAMVGGFLKSMGVDNKTLKELNVGMPTF